MNQVTDSATSGRANRRSAVAHVRRCCLVLVSVGLLSLSPEMHAQNAKTADQDLRLLEQAVEEQRRRVLFSLDHAALAADVRKFADDVRRRGHIEGPTGVMYRGDDVVLPESLRALSPTWIKVFNDYARVEFGGALLHMGIVVFRPGIDGEGTKKIADGVWFDAEDGKLPTK
jgi:hypothetical protein